MDHSIPEGQFFGALGKVECLEGATEFGSVHWRCVRVIGKGGDSRHFSEGGWAAEDAIMEEI
jgi:hypothetical protein